MCVYPSKLIVYLIFDYFRHTFRAYDISTYCTKPSVCNSENFTFMLKSVKKSPWVLLILLSAVQTLREDKYKACNAKKIFLAWMLNFRVASKGNFCRQRENPFCMFVQKKECAKRFSFPQNLLFNLCGKAEKCTWCCDTAVINKT